MAKKPKAAMQTQPTQFPEDLMTPPEAGSSPVIVGDLPPAFGSDIDDNWLTNLNNAQESVYTTPKPNSYNVPDVPEWFGDLPIDNIFKGEMDIESKVYNPNPNSPKYIFNEGNLLKEIEQYINSTYSGHYAGNYQATDIIIDAGHGIGFTLGNVIKYAKRYGKKEGFNRKDLLKMIHYAILSLYVHDYNIKNSKEPNE